MVDVITLDITRIFDAPREVVYDAWADPEQIVKWCCPDNYHVTFRQGDHKAGGAYSTGMKGEEDRELIYGGEYLEMNPPEKLVFTHKWVDSPEYTYPHTTCVVELKDLDGKTEMHFTQTGFNVVAEREGHRSGWTQIFEKLNKELIGR